jgi:hypothetical protein
MLKISQVMAGWGSADIGPGIPGTYADEPVSRMKKLKIMATITPPTSGINASWN